MTYEVTDVGSNEFTTFFTVFQLLSECVGSNC